MKHFALFLAAISSFSFLCAQNVGIGTPTPQAQLSVGTNSEFRVNASGNITRINNVPYSYPSLQGASGKTLVNDGTGNMSWKEASLPVGSIIQCYAYDTAALLAKGFVIESISESFSRSRVPRTGTWTPAAGIATTGGFYMQDNPSVWSGSEMLVYYNNVVYRWNPTGTVWTLSSVNPVAYNPSSGASAVWTGTEMIIYGGVTGSASNKGVKYNPSSNTWTAIASSLNNKTFHSAVWTGTNMIVWGGDSLANSSTGSTQSGYTYNPVSNTWSGAFSSISAPNKRANHSAAWSAGKMYIYGGSATSGSQE